MNKDRVELCCHTKMSKLQGIDSIKEYIEEAIKRGYKSIAITDTYSTQAYFEAEEYIKQYNTTNDFKIIYGIELNFKENKNSNETYTIYIYVKEQKGLKNLYELVSDSYKNIVKDKPLIYKKELDKYRDGLLYAAIGKESEAYQNIESLDISNIFDYYDFIGIEPNNSEKNINKKISDICTKTKKLLIGTSECNFINKDDYKCNEILNFYKKSNNIEEGNNKYFQNTDELIKCFNYIENAEEIVVANPQKIADEIENIELISKKAHYPIIKNSKKILREDCYNKVYALYGKNLSKVVRERLELELNSITNNNFETIYLISSELVKYSNELGYKVGCRGSVGNSFVAYLLGITNINPIDYNLPFEIFAGKDYDKEPDIDLNFSGKIQTKIFDYLQKKYGKDKIIWGGTVGSLADKIISNCYKEYISTFEIENGTDKDEIIKKLIGVKRCTGEHPGGIFIVPDDMDITDLCPIEIGEKGHIKTHNDYHSIWNSGLYKFDILTHDDPTMIYELEKETNINSNNIDLEDKETLKLFLHANDKSYEISTDGIPEFGTSFVKKMIDIVKPRKFNDLVCIFALSHGTNTWTYNASSLIKKEGKKVDEVISNRADMYNYLIANGIDKNITCDIVKFVRMGKASKGRTLWQHTNDRYKENNDKWTEYKKVMQKQNIPDWYINSAEKISYMFPKSHAIEYSTNAFKIAWYKVHYPEAFYNSSDMIGYGYYFYDENSTDFIRDDKFNYDSFEYYDGELKGKNRILKDISNFMKGKIELELFVHAYDYFKSDFKNEFPDFYTDEGLKLAGFSDIDILQKNHESEKIYNMPNEKRDDYLKHRTCIYEKLEEKEILQIETDFNNKVFLLTKNGILYKTELYEHELLKISKNIRKIHFLDGNHLYKISNENIILPIEDKNSFDNTDRYLNNNNCKYKKIETSKMHIVLLTQDGNVRAVCGGYPNLGIIPENFTNVNDITIVTNENGIDMPYIYKNNMFIELYIE